MSVIITGMHRSGTSAAARVVDAFGLSPGAGPLMEPAPDNPRGFFERRDVADFNDAWLRRLGGSWWAPPPTTAHTWRNLDDGDLGRGRESLDLFDAASVPWYSKDPRTALLLPLWDRLALRRHPVIVCLRHPGEVAASLGLRNGMSARRALALWATYTVAAVNHVGDRPAFVIDYAAALDAPRETIALVEEFLHETGHGPRAAWSRDDAAQLFEQPLRRASVPSWNEELLPHRKQLLDLYRHLAKRHGQSLAETGRIMLPVWVDEVLDELHELLDHEIRRDEAVEGVRALRAERERLLGDSAVVAQRQADQAERDRSLTAARDEAARLSATLRDVTNARDGETERVRLLEARLQERTREVEDLGAHLASTREQLASLRGDAEQLAGQVADRTRSRDAATAEAAVLRMQLLELQQRLDGATRRLLGEQQALADHREQLDAARAENDKRRTAMTEMSAELERRRGRAYRAESLAVQRAGELEASERIAVQRGAELEASERHLELLTREVLVVRFQRDQLRDALERNVDLRGQTEQALDLVLNSNTWRLGRALAAPVRLIRGTHTISPGSIRLTPEQRRDLVEISQSGIFDADWYLATSPDVAAAGLHPLEHFVMFGWREGRDPGPFFSVQYYLGANPDVVESNLNPLTHYLTWGWREGRPPRPDFDQTERVEVGASTDGISPLIYRVARSKMNGATR